MNSCHKRFYLKIYYILTYEYRKTNSMQSKNIQHDQLINYWSSGKAFVSAAGGLRFKFRAGQIRQSFQ